MLGLRAFSVLPEIPVKRPFLKIRNKLGKIDTDTKITAFVQNVFGYDALQYHLL